MRVSDVCSVFDNIRNIKTENMPLRPQSQTAKVREEGVVPVRKIDASLLPSITDGRI